MEACVVVCVCVRVCTDSFVLELQVLNIQPELFVAWGICEPDPHFAFLKKAAACFQRVSGYHIMKRPDSSCVSVRAKMCPACFCP